jgi:hypothetical protein
LLVDPVKRALATRAGACLGRSVRPKRSTRIQMIPAAAAAPPTTSRAMPARSRAWPLAVSVLASVIVSG